MCYLSIKEESFSLLFLAKMNMARCKSKRANIQYNAIKELKNKIIAKNKINILQLLINHSIIRQCSI